MASYDDLESLLDNLTTWAIKADMWDRGYHSQSGGDHGSEKFFNTYDGREVHRGNPGANDMNGTDDTTNYESAVFGAWPPMIDEIFGVWKAGSIPAPEDFDGSISLLRDVADRVLFRPVIKPPADVMAQGFPETLPDCTMAKPLRNIDTEIWELSGTWIENFRDMYVGPLPWTLGNQRAMIDFMAGAIAAEAEIWRTTQQAVADLAEKGATWFESTMFDGNVMGLVITMGKALKTGFDSITGAIEDPLTILGAVGDLAGAGSDVKDAIEANEPPQVGEVGAMSVSGVRTLIAQSLEYGLCREIEASEQKLQRIVQAGINAMQGSPATFTMGDHQAGQVAEATDVLAPTQTLHWDTIHRLVKSLQTLGDLTQAMANDIYVSTYPWMRPAGIGIDTDGPASSVIVLQNTIITALHDTGTHLEHVANLVRIAARYAHAEDETAKESLAKVNQRLDAYQAGMADDPSAPTQGEIPWTPPPGEVYQDQPDCAPSDDPFAPSGGDGTSVSPAHPPFAHS